MEILHFLLSLHSSVPLFCTITLISFCDVFFGGFNFFSLLIQLEWYQRKSQSLVLVLKLKPNVLGKNYKFFLVSKKKKTKKKTQKLFWNHLSSPRVPHLEKKHFFFLRHSLLWGLQPCSWPCRNLYLQSVLYPQNMDAKWKPFCTRPMEKRGNERKLVPKNQLPREEWECSLSWASTKHSRSEANIHLTL